MTLDDVKEAYEATLDKRLLSAALCICLAIFCDFLQYALGALIWFVYFRRKEKQGVRGTATFTASPWLNVPTWTLFFLKAAVLLLAYGAYIIPFLMAKFAA